jgi:hypothetical protein
MGQIDPPFLSMSPNQLSPTNEPIQNSKLMKSLEKIQNIPEI